MTTVIVSDDYEITIPEKICKALGIVPGQQLYFLSYNNQMILVPRRPIDGAKGAYPGLDTTIEDEPDREL